MNVLTNGSSFIHPLHTSDVDSERLRFSAIWERIDAQQVAQWWGAFRAADELDVRVDAECAALLRVEILDQDFRVLAAASGRGPAWNARALTRFAGVAYIRVHNLGATPANAVIRVERRTLGAAVKTPPARRFTILPFRRTGRAAA